MSDDDKPKRSPAIYRLTPEESDSLRAEMQRSMAWAKEQLAIDPELRHLDDDRQAPADNEEAAGHGHERSREK